MSSEEEKFEEEKFYFERFCETSKLDVDLKSIEKLNPPNNPDIRCMVGRKIEYFEMARMCSRDAAHMVNSESEEARWLDDPVEATLFKKLSCTYTVKGPVHLILYDLGLLVFPPDVVVPKLKHALTISKKNGFTNIWYLAEGQAFKIS